MQDISGKTKPCAKCRKVKSGHVQGRDLYSLNWSLDDGWRLRNERGWSTGTTLPIHPSEHRPFLNEVTASYCRSNISADLLSIVPVRRVPDDWQPAIKTNGYHAPMDLITSQD
jgi:hypothetical protein